MSGKDLQFSLNFERKNKILEEIHNLDNKKRIQFNCLLKVNIENTRKRYRICSKLTSGD